MGDDESCNRFLFTLYSLILIRIRILILIFSYSFLSSVILIGTHQDKSAVFFWNIARRTALQENPIVCWKFCHVLHKLLRDGHRRTIADSYQFRGMITDLGKMWGLLKEGYGKLIHLYSTLLVNRLEFHARNPRFPGNLHVSDGELDQIGEADVNVFFQLAVEMFDCLDDILNLQTAIFASLDTTRASSMTNAGQCRLAPLIPCIQDSSCLYDYCVKVLFKLHSALPASTLEGHRSRCYGQFKLLKQFYVNSSHLQYFKNLIQVPALPENPPNFLRASDLRDYVTPIVRVQNESFNDSPEGSEVGSTVTDTLIDISVPSNNNRNNSVNSDVVSDRLDSVSMRSYAPSEPGFTSASVIHSNGFGSMIEEKNRMINKLMAGINELHAEHQGKQLDYERSLEKMRKHILDLEQQRIEMERTINALKIEKESSTREIEELKAELERHKKGTDSETELAKVQQNYQIMKDAYAKMRSEHLELIRAKADTEKQLNLLKSASVEAQREKERESNESKDIGDQLKEELSQMEKVINDAAWRIEQLAACSKKTDTGIKLEVNEKILDSCTDLIQAIIELIADAKSLQEEIVSQGKGSASVTEFYQRNHRWTEGLISAAKVVAQAAKLLVDSSDEVVNGSAKFSELMAASNEVSAATVQLYVASRIKAEKNSEKLAKLSISSKKVSVCTGNIVAMAKVCAEKLEDDTSKLDFTRLSLTQAKRLEFESQARMIELQTELEREREKLAALRRQHYHLPGFSEKTSDESTD